MEEPEGYCVIQDPKFWARIAVLPDSGGADGLDCWIIMAERRPHGHATIHRIIDGRDKNIPAHRYAWYLYYGEFPPPRASNQWVLHRVECKDGLCIRKEHLYLGSHQQNMQDLADGKKSRNAFTGRLYRPHWRELLGQEPPPVQVHGKLNGRQDKIRIAVEIDLARLREMTIRGQNLLVHIPPIDGELTEVVEEVIETSENGHIDELTETGVNGEWISDTFGYWE